MSAKSDFLWKIGYVEWWSSPRFALSLWVMLFLGNERLNLSGWNCLGKGRMSDQLTQSKNGSQTQCHCYQDQFEDWTFLVFSISEHAIISYPCMQTTHFTTMTSAVFFIQFYSFVLKNITKAPCWCYHKRDDLSTNAGGSVYLISHHFPLVWLSTNYSSKTGMLTVCCDFEYDVVQWFEHLALRWED